MNSSPQPTENTTSAIKAPTIDVKTFFMRAADGIRFLPFLQSKGLTTGMPGASYTSVKPPPSQADTAWTFRGADIRTAAVRTNRLHRNAAHA